MHRGKPTVVLGVGNPIVSDDRVGLAVAEQVQCMLNEHPVYGVDVRFSTRGGLEILDLLSGYSRAILVDCLSLPDAVPGRVRRLSSNELLESPRIENSHAITLADAFRIADRLSIPMPDDIEVFGVEAGDAVTISDEMTEEVRAVVNQVAAQIHAMLVSADSEQARLARLDADERITS